MPSQKRVEYPYFIVDTLFKKCKIILNVFSSILKEGRCPMEVFFQSNPSNILRNSSD